MLLLLLSLKQFSLTSKPEASAFPVNLFSGENGRTLLHFDIILEDLSEPRKIGYDALNGCPQIFRKFADDISSILDIERKGQGAFHPPPPPHTHIHLSRHGSRVRCPLGSYFPHTSKASPMFSSHTNNFAIIVPSLKIPQTKPSHRTPLY